MSHWLDDERKVGRLLRAFYAACAVALAAGLGHLVFTHAYDHVHFDFERWPAFSAVFGFVAFLLVVGGGVLLRRVVSRPDEDFYDDDAPIDGATDDEGLGP